MVCPEKVVHIKSKRMDYVNLIYTAMQEAKLDYSRNKVLIESGLGFTERLRFLPLIQEKLQNAEKQAYQIAYKERKSLGEEHIFIDEHEGYAIAMPPDTISNTIIYFHSLIFELNSSYELLLKFFTEVYKTAGHHMCKNCANTTINSMLKSKGNDTLWIKELHRIRNHFIHESCAFFAIDITDQENKDLLFMKENLHNFHDERKYVRLKTTNNIFKEFFMSIKLIQKHLIEILKNKSPAV